MTIRNLFIAMLLLVAQLTATGATITKEQARQQASLFLQKQAATARGTQAQSQSLQLAIDSRLLYGFNIGQKGEGFIIVSGDDRTTPILGYALQGSLDEASMPPAMKALLDSYRLQMSQEGFTHRPSRIQGQPIAPLLKTEWNQTGRFNALCPELDDKRSVTGCVATAMSQVMNYHQWPATTTDTIPGYISRSQSILVDSLPPTAFNWAIMDEPGNDEVARLMLYAGTSVGMDYSPANSGASNANIPNALITYFGYDRSMRRMMRNYFNKDLWEQTIYEELLQGRPVIYAGQTYTNEGHAFVCDGYAGDGYFHINWGWGGLCDGNFLLSVCEPEMGGTGSASIQAGYSIDQEMLIGIQPAKEETTDGIVRLSTRSLELRSSSEVTRTDASQDFSDIQIYYELFCTTNKAQLFDYGMAVYKDSQLRTLLFSTKEANFSPNQYAYRTATIKMGGLEDGDYRIVLVSRAAGEEEWQQAEASDIRYIDAHIEGNTLTLQQFPRQQLMVRKLFYPDGRHLGQGGRWQATIENIGSEYNGVFYVINDKAIVAGSGAYIPSGETAEINFIMQPASRIDIATDKAGKNIIYSGPDVMESYSDLSLNTPELINGNSIKAGQVVEAKVNISRGADISSYKLAYQIDELPLVDIPDVPSLEKDIAATCYFSFTLPADLEAGRHTLSFCITHINGEELSNQKIAENRQQLGIIVFREGMGRQKVLIEHFTSIGRGYATMVDPVLAQVKGLRENNDFTIISIHQNATYGDETNYWTDNSTPRDYYPTYTGMLSYNVFPQTIYDRYCEDGTSTLFFHQPAQVLNSPQTISNRIDEMFKQPAFAELQLSAIKTGPNSIRIQVDGRRSPEFVTFIGSANLTLSLTEDSVVCPQYDGISSWIEDYKHMNVLRAVLTPAWGTPVTWKSDGTFSYTFNYTVPETSNLDNMKAIAFLGKPYTGDLTNLHIINCNDLRLANLDVDPFEYPAENQMMLAYHHGSNYEKKGVVTTEAGTYKAAFLMPKDTMARFENYQLTHLRFALTNPQVSEVKVFLANTLDGGYILSQPIDSLDLVEGWNEVKLDEAHIITSDSLYVGFEYYDAVGDASAIAYSPIPDGLTDRFYLCGPDGEWKSVSADYGCVALQGMMTIPVGIEVVRTARPATPQHFSLDGRRLSHPQRGLNIIRQADGTVRKVIIK